MRAVVDPIESRAGGILDDTVRIVDLSGFHGIAVSGRSPGPHTHNGRNSTGLRLDFSDLRTAVATLAQFAESAGAVVVLFGSIGRQSGRPSARTLMLVGCCIIVAADVLSWGFRMLLMFGGSPTFPRSLGTTGMLMYVGYTLGYTLTRTLLPALTVWVLRRPVIRQQYEGAVSLG